MTAPDVSIDTTPRRKPPAWVLPLGITMFATVLVCGWIANSVWARWIDTHPLQLIGLSPINRHLILVANDVDFGPFFVIALIRHLIPDPVFYIVGYWFGARALLWIAEGNTIAERLVGDDGRGLEDPSHRRYLYPLAFIMPNNWVSVFCGAARIPFRVFLVINICGTAARIGLCKGIAVLFEDQVNTLSDWITRYQLPVTIVSIVCVAIAMSYQLRPQGALRQMSQLDDEE